MGKDLEKMAYPLLFVRSAEDIAEIEHNEERQLIRIMRANGWSSTIDLKAADADVKQAYLDELEALLGEL